MGAQSSAVAALLRAGWDTAGLNRDRLRDLARLARRATVRSAADTLFAAGGAQ